MANADVIAKASIGVSCAAFFSGCLIAIVAAASLTWSELKPLADSCLAKGSFIRVDKSHSSYNIDPFTPCSTDKFCEDSHGAKYPDSAHRTYEQMCKNNRCWLNETNTQTYPMTQCGAEERFYFTDIPNMDTQMAIIVNYIQTGVVLVGLAAAVMNLPPICSAIGKKNGQRCLEKCCGCISCFSTLIGLALGVACIVLPYMATSMLDQHICAKFGWILDEIEKHQENLGEYCIQECISVLLGFFKTLCGFKGKFMTIAGVSFLLVLTAFASFIVNAISCCMKSKDKDGNAAPVQAQIVPVAAVQPVQDKA